MTEVVEEQVANRLAQLRAHGHDAHLHPVTRQIAVWYRERWWHVVGGSFEAPSLIAVKEPAKGPRV